MRRKVTEVQRWFVIIAVLLILTMVLIRSIEDSVRQESSVAGKGHDASSEVHVRANILEKAIDSGKSQPKDVNGVLKAKVTDAESGQVISNIIVSIAPVSRDQRSEIGKSNSLLAIETDSGVFFIDDLLPGIWSMRVQSEGYSDFVISRLEIVASQVTRELKIPMRTGSLLSGRVLDAETGMPIAKAQIKYRDNSPHDKHIEVNSENYAVTDENGQFVISGIKQGSLDVTARFPGYAELTTVINIDGDTEMDFSLNHGSLITGQLLDQDGASLLNSGGKAILIDRRTGTGEVTSTDEKGRFHFEGVAPGAFELQGQMDRGFTNVETVVIRENEDARNIALTLQSGGTISGRVVDTQGTVIEKQVGIIGRIYVSAWSGGTKILGKNVDSTGHFELEGLPSAQITIQATTYDKRRLKLLVDLRSTTQAHVELFFDGGASLIGTVTRRGRPASAIKIQATSLEGNKPSARSTTSRSGQYRMDNLGVGPYLVGPIGFAATEEIYVTDNTEHNIVLPECIIRGEIRESSNDQAVENVSVSARQPSDSRETDVITTTTDSVGQFSLEGLRCQEFTLAAYKQGYSLATIRLSAAVEDVTIRAHTITVQNEEGVSINVVDSNSKLPMPYVNVAGKGKSNDSVTMQLLLDAAGSGSLPSALIGMNLSISHSGYERAEVANWGGNELRVELESLSN